MKQRMQLYGSQKLYGVGVWSCARAVAREGGLRAFYVSYPTTVAMNIPVFETSTLCVFVHVCGVCVCHMYMEMYVRICIYVICICMHMCVCMYVCM